MSLSQILEIGQQGKNLTGLKSCCLPIKGAVREIKIKNQILKDLCMKLKRRELIQGTRGILNLAMKAQMI